MSWEHNLDMRAGRTGSGRVGALVLTWNSVDLIDRCLTSLADHDSAHVLVVDNASSDGTAEAVRERFPSIQLLETGENMGFAGGCNAGIRQLLQEGFEYIFLLNPDAFVDSDCIALLASHLDANQHCGALSPLIHDHPSNSVWFAGSDIDWTTGSTLHRDQGAPAAHFGTLPITTERINGGAVMLRSTALHAVGLFDESYFLYYEETDLSVRLSRAGWNLEVLPIARAWHEASSSTGGNLGRIFNYYLIRGRLNFLQKRTEGRVHWTPVLIHIIRETRWLTKTFGLRVTAPAVRMRMRAIFDFVRGREGRATL